jgi:hypothetical protein
VIVIVVPGRTGCSRFVKILFDQGLIIKRGAATVIVQHLPAGEEAGCVHLLFSHLRELHVDAVDDP